jgi:hypothetical protein
MYSHIKALTRMGAADIPAGTSMEREGSGSGSGSGSGGRVDAKNFGAMAAAMAKDAAKGGAGAPAARVHGFGGGGTGSIAASTEGAMATAAKGVGNARVHGFGSGAGTGGGTTGNAMATAGKGVANVHGFGGGSKPTLTSTFHNHEDSFQRRKGVVNTVGGARDIARKQEDVKLPGKGEKKGAHVSDEGERGAREGGRAYTHVTRHPHTHTHTSTPLRAQIMGMDMLDQHTTEGKARRAAAEKRIAAAGNPVKTTAVHVSGGGGRPPVAGLGGGKPKPADIYKEKMAKMESAPAPRVKLQATVNVLDENLGGAGIAAKPSAAGGAAGGGDDVRAARAAHFDKMFAEQQAKKKAAAAAAGLA